MSQQFPLPDDESSPREAFLQIQSRLVMRRIATIQFVYGVLADIPHVTLCAMPIIDGEILKLSHRTRHRLICTFCDWMAWHESDWLAGPDCVGVLTWDLSTAHFTHRHHGYTQHFFSRSHSDEPSEVRRTRSAEPLESV
jgi:hypothetical protein